jgi:heme/copper-type cytochrome/quinol oxidase subunit 2
MRMDGMAVSYERQIEGGKMVEILLFVFPVIILIVGAGRASVSKEIISYKLELHGYCALTPYNWIFPNTCYTSRVSYRR